MPSGGAAARWPRRAGLIATGYERAHGAHSRVHQFALVYLFAPSSQVYTCPLAMSDGAARTLETLASAELRGAVLPRLIARDPARGLDQRAVDDGAHRRLGRGALGDRGEAHARGLAPVRRQVVHLGDELRGGAHAGAARGQRARRQGPRALLRAHARRAGPSESRRGCSGSRRSSAPGACPRPRSSSTARRQSWSRARATACATWRRC